MRTAYCVLHCASFVVHHSTAGPLAETDLRILWRKQISLHGSAMADDREFRAVMGLLAAGGQFGKVVLEVGT